MWALSNPDAEVLATDLSGAVVDLAADLACQLGLSNVRFERQDLSKAPYQEQFDLVVCTGVVHHLPKPEAGLRRVRQALKPDGAVVLMVYSRMHRGPLRLFRQTLELLAEKREGTAERYDLACDLLEQLTTSERSRPPSREAFELLLQSRQDRAFVADAVLHPLETCYDIDELLALLEQADLELTSWLYPAQWELDRYVSSPALSKRFERLDPIAQSKVVYFVAGAAGPLLELIAEPRSAPDRPPYSLAELLAMPLVLSEGLRAYTVDGGRVVNSVLAPAYEIRDGLLVGQERGASGVTYTWKVPREIEPLLRACDGRRTLGEILDQHTDPAQRMEVLQVLAELLPSGLGLLAPAHAE